MGLFDKLRGGGEGMSLTPQGGLLLAAITMIAADGDVDDDELAIVRRLDGPYQTKDWDDAVRAWKMYPLEKCIEMATASMNAEQRTVAIANLIDIAMADGVLAGNEEKLLNIYVEAFNIPYSIVEKIVEVIAIKNNKALFRE